MNQDGILLGGSNGDFPCLFDFQIILFFSTPSWLFCLFLRLGNFFTETNFLDLSLIDGVSGRIRYGHR